MFSQRSVRRGLWGAGALVALGALGASVLVFSGGSASTSTLAPSAVTRLGTTAAGSGELGTGSPEIVGHALASEPAAKSRKAAAKHAKALKPKKPTASAKPKATSSAPAGHPTASTPAGTTPPPSASNPPSAPAAGPPPSSTPVTAGGDPSGQSPASSLPGFSQVHVEEFNGNSIPAGWDAYTGVPGGSTSQEAQWTPSMCDFSGGEAHFEASGVNSCGLQHYGTPQTYGAWFVRLKADGMPSGVSFSSIFLLFPANNQWPPEIDVYEDHGTSTSTVESMYNTVGNACGSSPTGSCLAQYGASNGQQGGTQNDNLQWHTYGLEWTPSGVTWLIDGRVVFTAPASAVHPPAAQPDTPMYLDLQDQNINGTSGTPNQIETMSVDWVQQFSWNG